MKSVVEWLEIVSKPMPPEVEDAVFAEYESEMYGGDPWRDTYTLKDEEKRGSTMSKNIMIFTGEQMDEAIVEAEKRYASLVSSELDGGHLATAAYAKIGTLKALRGAMTKVSPRQILGLVEEWKAKERWFFEAPVGFGKEPESWENFFLAQLEEM